MGQRAGHQGDGPSVRKASVGDVVIGDRGQVPVQQILGHRLEPVQHTLVLAGLQAQRCLAQRRPQDLAAARLADRDQLRVSVRRLFRVVGEVELAGAHARQPRP